MEYTSLLMGTQIWQIEPLDVSELCFQLQKRSQVYLPISGGVSEAGVALWHTGPMSERQTGMVAATSPAIT
jgi:hypothetical protein